MNSRDLVRPAAAEAEYDTEPASHSAVSMTLVLVVVGLSLVLLPGVAALLIIRDGDPGGADADALETQSDPSVDAALEPTTTNPNGSSSTTASTTTTPATTTTEAPSAGAGTALPTTAPPTTAAPTTAPTTTGPPEPVIDSFDVDIDQGCGRGSSIARFSWATSQATTVTLGRADGSSEQVPADGQASTCVDDDGETWRLTAAGSNGSTTRDLRIEP